MSKSRKTVDVEFVRDLANKLMALPDSAVINSGYRMGVARVLEAVLHETDNYAGFNYKEWLDTGCTKWNNDGRPENKADYLGDETRRHYYKK